MMTSRAPGTTRSRRPGAISWWGWNTSSDSAREPPGGDECPIFPKQGRRAVVLCDGPQPSHPHLEYWLEGADVFVCADGGGHPYTHLPRLPDAVIGDFDSLAGRILLGKDGPRYLHSPDQDTTDAEKALHYVLEEGATEAILLGAFGGRLDQSLFNVSLLEQFSDAMRICISGPQDDAVRIGSYERVAWDLPAGTLFSLLPLAGPAFGVTLGGAAYALDNAIIRVGGPATVSNRVARPPLRVATTGGSLLVMVANRGWPELE